MLTEIDGWPIEVLEFGAASEASGPRQVIQVLEGLGRALACNAITDSQSKELEQAWETCGRAHSLHQSTLLPSCIFQPCRRNACTT